MPVSTERQADLDVRRTRVAQLYGLGMSRAQVANALGVSPLTIAGDIAFLRLPAHVEQSAGDSFARLFECYAVLSTIEELSDDKRSVVERSHPGPYTLKQLAESIERILDLTDVWSRLVYEADVLRMVVHPEKNEPEWCYQLLEAVFGPRHHFCSLIDLREAYLSDVAHRRMTLPENTEEVCGALSQRLVADVRRHIRPDWSESRRVEQKVFDALTLLDAHEFDVLVLRFREQKDDDGIAETLGASLQDIRSLEARAMHKLRHPSRSRLLAPLWEPVSLSWEASVDTRQSLDDIRIDIARLFERRVKQAVIAELSDGDVSTAGQPQSAANEAGADIVGTLCRTVDEFQFSVRVANCLRDMKVKYVWDLCTKTEADLMRNRNFGRHSLNEVKLTLMALAAGHDVTLTLGMSPSDPNIAAAMERCPRD